MAALYYFFETTAASWRVESAGKDSQDGRLPGVVQAKNEDPDLPLLRLELLEDGEKTHGAASSGRLGTLCSKSYFVYPHLHLQSHGDERSGGEGGRARRQEALRAMRGWRRRSP